MPPLHPLYQKLFYGKHISDLHPGLRFERAISYVSDNREQLVSSYSRSTSMTRADRICKALEWPTLRALAGELNGLPTAGDDRLELHCRAVKESAKDISLFVMFTLHDSFGDFRNA